MLSLSDWEAYIQTVHHRSIDMQLERVAAVLERLGGAPARARVITVGGTNGKGSCVAMLEAILLAAGYRVGAYSSPHLVRYNERVRILGEQAPDDSLCTAFERVEAVRGDIPLTYFEFGTLAALECFRAAAVDVMVLEVGLGGRLDAVNALDADCALVASIGLDHRDWLGPDREHIGREKAGIFRHGRPAVCGDPDPPQSILDGALASGARLYLLGRDFSYRQDDNGWRWQGPRGTRNGLPAPALRGDIQLANAASVLMVLDALHELLPVDQAAVRRGLTEVRLPGRFQTLPGVPRVVLDVAHNLEAVRELKRNLACQTVPGRSIAVCAILRDKPLREMFSELSDSMDCWHLASLEGSRAATAQELADRLQEAAPGASYRVHHDPVAAWQAAQQDATEADRIVVFGSFYTVGAIMAHLSTQQLATA